MSTTPPPVPDSVTYGWDYRPGTFRCARGWNATILYCREWRRTRRTNTPSIVPREPPNLCIHCNVTRCSGTWCSSCNETIEAEGERRSEAITWRQWWRGYPAIKG